MPESIRLMNRRPLEADLVSGRADTLNSRDLVAAVGLDSGVLRNIVCGALGGSWC